MKPIDHQPVRARTEASPIGVLSLSSSTPASSGAHVTCQAHQAVITHQARMVNLDQLQADYGSEIMNDGKEVCDEYKKLDQSGFFGEERDGPVS
jgi:hypothetical protein